MDRVLKRVGLSRRSLAPSAPPLSADEDVSVAPPKNQRRRRRSKSRRRSTTSSNTTTNRPVVDAFGGASSTLSTSAKPAGVPGASTNISLSGIAVTTTTKKSSKSRGIFSFDWDSVRDCRSCKSRALLSKRFCSRKCDNELYRSNSFKFERFVRGDGDNDGVSTLGKKISLCDDYSIPLDDVNRRRPNSIAAPSASDWNISSPNEDKVEVLETYSTPRDFKQRLSQHEEEEWEREYTAAAAAAAAAAEHRTLVDDAEQKCFTSPDREYSQPYTTDASSAPSSDEEFFGHRVGLSHRSDAPKIELNSPDSITEAGIVPIEQIENKTESKRHPSPYYYSDLLKPRVVEPEANPTTSRLQVQQQQQQLLHSETIFSTKSECHPRNRYEFERQLLFQTTGADKEKKDKKNHKSCGYHKKYRKTSESSGEKRHSKHSQRAQAQQLALALLNDVHEAVGTSTSSGAADRLFYPQEACGEDDVDEVDMTRQRHVYETAFDSRVLKSDDDLDEIDKASNHSVLSHIDPDRRQSAIGTSRSTSRCRSAFQTDQSTVSARVNNSTISRLSTQLEKMHIPEGSRTMGAMPLRGYTPSPPSTAPLPNKFHGKELIMNSIRSAPNLPSHSKARLKHLHLPIKGLGIGLRNESTSNSAFDIPKSNSEVRPEKDQRVLEIKDRPRKDLLLFKRSKDGKGGTILEFKSRRRRHKYSSTESMTTSSSGGSMESIKSSTSEGNRSSTSTESRNSSSLSSHDSDSGAASNYLAAQTSFQSNKLHILSPISDKSSQEPVSEISDNNRNNNSQKCSPEEITDIKSRRRLPQNKNLLNLGLHADPEIQGSDSGISIQSRGEGVKSRFALGELSSSGGQNNDFSDLPFDMPKLRRRKLAVQEAACTSSSATSIDFGDLPFDMPKLRRRLRVQQTPKELSVSQASSSQSMADPEGQGMSYRPKLSLNLDGNSGKQKPGLGLALSGLGFNSVKSPTRAQELIDIHLPLEKQGWYHGAITRVEAENVLRVLREGSFLVRNSESTKQDYSLSLKSARGFMHMRIQRDETNGTRSYILGQFSKPFTSIPEMIKHFSLNGLPIRGAEHMCLAQPVILQLL